MSVYVELQTDAFADQMAFQKYADRSFKGVRRPFRGIEIKEDTYAIMKVLRADGSSIPLVDAGGPIAPGGDLPNVSPGGPVSSVSRPGTFETSKTTTHEYSNFIIQNIADSRQEKSQILETFGDPFIFFFGERPRILQINGLLLNTRDFNWRTEFWYNYEHYLRGTKLVELNARIYLSFDDILVEGYMMGAQATEDVRLPYHIQFAFSLFVTNYTYLGNIGDDAYPITTAVRLPMLTDGSYRDYNALVKDLKAHSPYTNDYESNVDMVRRELEKSEYARKAKEADTISGKIKSFMKSPTGQKLNASKNLIAGALAIGMHSQNLTFLSLVNHFFKNRKVLLPRGLAGSETYAGVAQYANHVEQFAAVNERNKPIRSKIRDNIDEYVGREGLEGDGGFQVVDLEDPDQKFTGPYALEKQLLLDLKKAGINPIQHPGGSPLTHGTYGIRAFNFLNRDMKTLMGGWA